MKSIILSAIKHGKPLATPKKGSKGRLGKLRRELKRLQKKATIIGSGFPPQEMTVAVTPRCPICNQPTRIAGYLCGRCFCKSLEVDTCTTHGLPVTYEDGSCVRCVEEKRVKDEGLDPALAGVRRVIDL